jgi:DNA-directed RNA polymerase specialized sigma24 family protein
MTPAVLEAPRPSALHSAPAGADLLGAPAGVDLLGAPAGATPDALIPVEAFPTAIQLFLPFTVLLVGRAAGAARMLRQRRYRRALHPRGLFEQLSFFDPPLCCGAAGRTSRCDRPAAANPLGAPKGANLLGAPIGATPEPAPLCAPLPVAPRRRRALHPRAAAHALALQHLDLADAIAGNFARRTIHPFEDLRQVAIIGLLKAADRYNPSGGRPFRPYARTYANGEIMHFLRDSGFAIKVPPTWRDQYASGQKLLREGVAPAQVALRLGITAQRWAEIQEACSITVVALPPEL